VVKNSTSARSPLSPTLWPPSAFLWWRSLVLLVTLLVAIAVAFLAFVAVYVPLYGAASLTHPSPQTVILSQAIVYVPAVLVLLVMLPWVSQRSLRELGLRAPTARDVAWGVAGTIGMIVVTEALSALEMAAFHVKISEQAVDVLKATRGNLIYVFAALACILAPFVEELIFRGFIFNAFLRYFPVPVAIVLSALCFGGAHFSPSALLPLAGGGLVLAYVYYRTGVLTASMIAHAGFNLFSIIGLVAFKLT
jgi:membrane protease YdiL (CAAX protease family)